MNEACFLNPSSLLLRMYRWKSSSPSYRIHCIKNNQISIHTIVSWNWNWNWNRREGLGRFTAKDHRQQASYRFHHQWRQFPISSDDEVPREFQTFAPTLLSAHHSHPTLSDLLPSQLRSLACAPFFTTHHINFKITKDRLAEIIWVFWLKAGLLPIGSGTFIILDWKRKFIFQGGNHGPCPIGFPIRYYWIKLNKITNHLKDQIGQLGT